MKRTTLSVLLLLTMAALLTACQPPALASSTSTLGPSATPTVYLPTAARGASPTATAEHLVTIGPARPEAPIRPLLGVNAGPVPAGNSGNPELTAAYQQIGVTQVRTHDFYGPLDMAVMYPDRTRDPADPNSYDFSASDAVWTAIIDGGFEPYLRLGDSWNNATPPSDPAERANWVQAAVQVVRHYREGQWDGFVSDLRCVEIWNEPDHQQFWPRPHTRLEFFQLFAETAQALKAAFPDLLVGGPGLAPAGCKTPQGQQYTEEFLAYLQGHDVPLDFFSWHMYANDPTDFANAVTFYRGLLDNKGYAAAESHITEWNTGIRDVDSPAEKLALRAGAKGAALMTAAWIGLQEQGVDEALFYRGPDATLQNPSWYGLFYADGRPKHVALAFSLWSQVAAHPEQLSLSLAPASGAPSALAAIAGQNAACADRPRGQRRARPGPRVRAGRNQPRYRRVHGPTGPAQSAIGRDATRRVPCIPIYSREQVGPARRLSNSLLDVQLATRPTLPIVRVRPTAGSGRPRPQKPAGSRPAKRPRRTRCWMGRGDNPLSR